MAKSTPLVSLHAQVPFPGIVLTTYYSAVVLESQRHYSVNGLLVPACALDAHSNVVWWAGPAVLGKSIAVMLLSAVFSGRLY